MENDALEVSEQAAPLPGAADDLERLLGVLHEHNHAPRPLLHQRRHPMAPLVAVKEHRGVVGLRSIRFDSIPVSVIHSFICRIDVSIVPLLVLLRRMKYMHACQSCCLMPYDGAGQPRHDESRGAVALDAEEHRVHPGIGARRVQVRRVERALLHRSIRCLIYLSIHPFIHSFIHSVIFDDGQMSRLPSSTSWIDSTYSFVMSDD